MDRRQAYEKELLETFALIAQGPSLASETQDLERRLLSRIEKAVQEMRAAIADVNRQSALVRISAQAFEDLVADEIPSAFSWNEKIAYAAKGW